jgi:hypothetical protein
MTDMSSVSSTSLSGLSFSHFRDRFACRNSFRKRIHNSLSKVSIFCEVGRKIWKKKYVCIYRVHTDIQDVLFKMKSKQQSRTAVRNQKMFYRCYGHPPLPSWHTRLVSWFEWTLLTLHMWTCCTCVPFFNMNSHRNRLLLFEKHLAMYTSTRKCWITQNTPTINKISGHRKCLRQETSPASESFLRRYAEQNWIYTRTIAVEIFEKTALSSNNCCSLRCI